jgi:hypothetical protein
MAFLNERVHEIAPGIDRSGETLKTDAGQLKVFSGMRRE